MSWQLQCPPALWIAAFFVAIGIAFMFAGEIGWIFGLPFHAAGLGCLAAAFTKV